MVGIIDRVRGFKSQAEKKAFEDAVKAEQKVIQQERIEFAAKRGKQRARQSRVAGLRVDPQAAQEFVGGLGTTGKTRKKKNPVDDITRMITG